MNRLTPTFHTILALHAFLWLTPPRPAIAAESADPHSTSAQSSHRGPACVGEDRFFADEVWTKVASQACLKCHKPGGDAEDSKLVLQDPAKDASPGQHESLEHNRAVFARLAHSMKGDQSRLLLKATGGLEHEGKEAIKADSPGYRILADFVRRVNAAPGSLEWQAVATPKDGPPFFDGISMLDNRQLLRRVTLSLGARLPRAEELASVEKQGIKALDAILGAVMKEDAFFDRLAEAFNDIFLTRGYDGVAETALSYDHFSQTRGWTYKYDLSSIKDETARRKAGYKLTDDYREAMLREPMELVKYIVRQDHPFSEIVTADYVMVSPFTSRGYGIFEELKDKFHNPEDPFEYVPVRLKALKHRDGKNHQESPTGFYPHAGMLSTFQYLRRYPTTETNRNRLRARMYYQQFLGIDVLELAARVTDAAAVSAKFAIPTKQAAECVVCHKTVDPVAGIFQDYYNIEGVYGRRKDGWYKDMFAAGFEGEDLPPDQRWRSLQWLGERTVKDPRFAATMVEHVYYILTGRKVLLPPKALDDPFYDAKLRAYLAQRKEIESIAARFAKGNFNLKNVFKDWVLSPFYRADAVATIAANPQRKAELSDLGVARVLAPEQLERKLAAIFTKPWGRLNDKQFAILYGGIDSKEVTERAADPSGAMGAIQRMMANDVACRNVALDFTTEPAKRRLFPNIEPDVVPSASPEAEQQIRRAIVYLHQQLLGRYDAADSPEVDRTYRLFDGILSDAHSRKGIEPLENYSCRGLDDHRVNDPQYTLRAWRAVVTYLLRREDFLYE